MNVVSSSSVSSVKVILLGEVMDNHNLVGLIVKVGIESLDEIKD